MAPVAIKDLLYVVSARLMFELQDSSHTVWTATLQVLAAGASVASIRWVLKSCPTSICCTGGQRFLT